SQVNVPARPSLYHGHRPGLRWPFLFLLGGCKAIKPLDNTIVDIIRTNTILFTRPGTRTACLFVSLKSTMECQPIFLLVRSIYVESGQTDSCWQRPGGREADQQGGSDPACVGKARQESPASRNSGLHQDQLRRRDDHQGDLRLQKQTAQEERQ